FNSHFAVPGLMPSLSLLQVLEEIGHEVAKDAVAAAVHGINLGFLWIDRDAAGSKQSAARPFYNTPRRHVSIIVYIPERDESHPLAAVSGGALSPFRFEIGPHLVEAVRRHRSHVLALLGDKHVAVLGVDSELAEVSESRIRTADHGLWCYISVVGSIENKHSGRSAGDAAGSNDEIPDGVNSDTDHVVQAGFGSAYGPCRRYISVGVPGKHQNAPGARIAGHYFSIHGIDGDRLRSYQPRPGSLNYPYGSFLSLRSSSEYEDCARQGNGHNDFVVHSVKGDAVHGAAQVSCLSFNSADRSDVTICH